MEQTKFIHGDYCVTVETVFVNGNRGLNGFKVVETDKIYFDRDEAYGMAREHLRKIAKAPFSGVKNGNAILYGFKTSDGKQRKRSSLLKK